MATAAAGIWNHPAASGSLPVAKPQNGTTGSSGTSSSTTEATISANDFLNLLVTELQNQDPTAQTDPNEYVNQLVAVNSLEQLININQTLGTAVGGTTGATGGSVAGTGPAAQAQPGTRAGSSLQQPASAARIAPGNIGIPQANASADRVAQALSGRLR